MSDKKKKILSNIGWAFGMIAMLAFIFLAEHYMNDPERLIKRYLKNEGYEGYGDVDFEIEKMEGNQYKILNPPIEMETNTPLVRWERRMYSSFSCYVYPMDLPKKETVQLSFELLEENYQRLTMEAEELGMTLDEFLESIIRNASELQTGVKE